ncbi:MAG: hypothetical protein A3C44_01715 [Gammaproteobacteria bacterium RIFCSPHIGHO2_02_FULL_39_13]|nr:MAG: hypothetical protein A3C44_01715 [Gammaproteobacteria bacterium RIFCSPHIGHO2_02_FULL_39_13]OGT49599.1 MAG: hypothetical protein A3E53_00460 [Gammaproteobacteria bacterium RIFCSPHIGHO2_12_FULL_39_24]
MTITIQDLRVRQQALDPTQSFIVQAPAGSGKTELLTQRYLVLLSRAQKAPEEIVAITFTRKAVAEMRARIVEALTLAQEPEPDKNHYRHHTWSLAQSVLKKDAAHQWQLQKNPNRLRILTIDALSAFLCRQTPLLSEFGATPTLCDNPHFLYEIATQRLLTEVIGEKKWYPHLEQLLLHLDNDAEKLEKLLIHLLDHRDQWLSHVMYAYQNHHTLREMLDKSLQRIITEKMILAVNNTPAHLKQTLLLLARHASPACANFVFEKKPLLNQFSSWFALANLLLTKEGEWRKSVDARIGFPPKDPNKSLMQATLTELESHNAFKEALRDIQLSPPAFYTDTQWETITALTQLLPLLTAQLSIVFQEKSQIDFIELNLRALKALGNDESPTDLALYLDFQIQHLLIDEFQDTSIVHLHLLEKIMAGWQPNDGRTLFLVGDPMQSIYRFRNAEVGLFLRAQEQGIGAISLIPLTLTMNFRSQENLVHWFNATFRTIFPTTSDISTGCVPYTAAIAAKPAIDNNDVQFYPIVNNGEGSESEKIAETMQFIKERNPHDTIALLIQSRAQFIPIAQALQQRHLSFQAIDIEPLAQRLEIQDLLSLTRALLHRADRIAWLAILRAPFCGLKLADLEIISNHAENKTIWEVILFTNSGSELSQDALSRINRIRYFLSLAFEKQSQLSLTEWIEGVWISLGGPACLSHENEIDYARSYFNLLSALEKNTAQFSIETLMKQCEKLFANTKTNTNNPIQILTIHKSKGLEFDHVFLPGLHRQPPVKSEKLLRWLERVNALGGDDLLLAPIKSITHQSDPIYDYLKWIENKKQDYEMTRLLYVAATRAKKSLHLFAIVSHDEKLIFNSPKKSSFLEKLWPVYEPISSRWLSHQSTINTENTIEKNKTENILSRLWVDSRPIEFEPTTAEFLYIDINLHPQQAKIIGTIIHEILQSISINTDFSISKWKSRLFSLGILPHEMETCVKSIKFAISNMRSDTRAQWILSSDHQDSHFEWTLTQQTEKGCESIVIDRSFIDKENTRWIIDYKTAIPTENESLEDFLKRQRETYQDKMQCYANLLATTENRPIKIGLYFPLCSAWTEWHHKLYDVV